MKLRPFALLLVAVLATTPVFASKPAPPDHWVATWAAAEVGFPANSLDKTFVPGAADSTIRQIVHTSIGGPLVRVEFSNALGTDPLTIGAAHIALAAPAPGAPTGDISLMSANALTFNGAPSITIPAGGEAISDPAALAVPATGDLVVTLFLPAQTINHITGHNDAFQTNFIAPGNVVGQRTLTGATPTNHWWFLKAIDVKAAADTGTIVAFGDSITDGYGSTLNANTRWPSYLASRLQADKKTRGLGVVNEGIGGNRVLRDGFGPNASARFERDVLSIAGTRYLILMEGINDIGNAFAPNNPHDPVTTDSMIAGLTQLAERAHAHGIKVFGATLTPYMGAGYSSPAGEQVRQAYNSWIRTSKLFDGVIDFDKATQSSSAPDKLNPAYDHGDHLHPSDAGYKAMSDAIDLKLFTTKN